jgi:hypothetical protein
MTRSFHALERSLRDGPLDESGYAAEAFELGSASAPAHTTRVRTLERVGLVGDRRAPRRLVPSFTTIATLALGAAIAVGGLALLGRMSRSGPGHDAGQPSPVVSPRSGAAAIPVPPLTETFVSTRNGFSVNFPAGWTVKPATTSWPQNIFLPIGNSALDDLQRPGEARLTVASQRLGAGQTQDEWLAAYVRPYRGAKPCSTDLTSSPRIPIGGQSGYLATAGCPMPADTKFSVPDVQFEAFVFAGGRVYEISLDGNVDLGYFGALVATIRLDPSRAIDPSSGP